MSEATDAYPIPNDRHYDGENHMWARWEPQSGRVAARVVVGVDTLGLASLGDLAYISFKEVGAVVKRGEPIGTLEAAKMTGDLVAPVTGTLVERNQGVQRDPGLVNSDPYGGGWLVAIEPTDWKGESAALVSGEAIQAWVASEVERYRSQGWID